MDVHASARPKGARRDGLLRPSGRRALAGCAILAAATVAAAAATEPQDRPAFASRTTVRARYLMGTVLTVAVEGPGGEANADAAFAEVARLERVLSNWIPDSEVSRLNRAAARGPVRCSRDLLDAVGASLRWAKRTSGAFDPTVEPLVAGLGLREAEGRIDGPTPAPPAISPRDVIGWSHVAVDAAAGTVRFERPGMGLDFGGIGKGIALDAAARVLRHGGVVAGSLDFGGQVLVFGRPHDGAGWPVGIADPDDRDRALGQVILPGGSISTSGNAERAAGEPPRRTGHIVDPVRGVPAAFSGSVTAVASDGTSADALSTGLFVMGPRDGIAWAGRRGVAALYLWREHGVLRSATTSAFRATFGEWSPTQGVSSSGVGSGRRDAAGAGW